jgi:signal transduction histidine kinase
LIQKNDSSNTAGHLPTSDEARSLNFQIPTVRWHESLVLRIGASVVVIMLAGYLASIYIAVEAIRSITKIAHREDIEESLTEHLALLKDNHKLRQELLIQRMAEVLPRGFERHGSASLQAGQLETLIEQTRARELFGASEVIVENYAPQNGHSDTSFLRWLDPERLRVGKLVASFAKGDTYSHFRDIESLRQAYKILGESLRNEVQPAMIKSAALVLLFSFAFLMGIFYLIARRFKVLVQGIIDGFVTWSEVDSSFRFDHNWQGELKLITSHFNQMAQEVEENRRKSLFLEKLASWQTIARKIAHEIKNPLTPIQMMVSQLARRYSGDDPDFRKLLDSAQQVITEEVSGLRRMVDNFSQFARLPVPQMKQVEIVGILERLAVLESAAFPMHKVEFKADQKELMVMADEDLLRQVIINLVKNAAEACANTASNIQIQLVDLSNHDYQIVVQDDGPGIPEDVQTRIFEAYFTTKHTGPNPGMGLGLAVCQKIIIDHGGEIRVTSKPGLTRFILKMPKRAGEAQHGR